MKPQELFLLYEKQVAEFKLNLIRKLSGETPLKRASNLSMIEAVLKSAGKPLHVRGDLITLDARRAGDFQPTIIHFNPVSRGQLTG